MVILETLKKAYNEAKKEAIKKKIMHLSAERDKVKQKGLKLNKQLEQLN